MVQTIITVIVSLIVLVTLGKVLQVVLVAFGISITYWVSVLVIILIQYLAEILK